MRTRGECDFTSPVAFLLLFLFPGHFYYVIYEPLLLEFLPAAIAMKLRQEIIEPVEKVRVSLTDGPCERFVSEGLIDPDGFIPIHGRKDPDLWLIIDEGVGEAVGDLKGTRCFVLKKSESSLGHQLFSGECTGDSQLAGDNDTFPVEIPVVFVFLLIFFVNKQDLADIVDRVTEINLEVSALEDCLQC